MFMCILLLYRLKTFLAERTGKGKNIVWHGLWRWEIPVVARVGVAEMNGSCSKGECIIIPIPMMKEELLHTYDFLQKEIDMACGLSSNLIKPHERTEFEINTRECVWRK